MVNWSLYVVRCRDGSLYTGITTNVARRFSEHQENGNKAAKYLRGRGPLVLVLQKEVESKGLALSVENRVKKLPKEKKEKLIRNHTYIEEIIRQINM